MLAVEHRLQGVPRSHRAAVDRGDDVAGGDPGTVGPEPFTVPATSTPPPERRLALAVDLHAEERGATDVHGARRLAGDDLFGDRVRGRERDREPLGRGLRSECAGCSEPAVMIPTTLPRALTSAPPESPGWIGASIWMSPDSCSEVPVEESCAVIDWSRAVTLPATTLGAPPLPRALPIATTTSPTETVEESPSGAVCSPEASASLMHRDVV